MVRDLLDQVRDTVCRNNLFSEGDVVFAAVSGGADSVAMLHLLTLLKEEYGIADIRVLHMNHSLRDTAERDENFVRSLCADLSMPLSVKRVDVLAEAQMYHETTEEAGRRLRYAFFEEEASKVPRAKIAVAHNADDHVETVLFHIIRGCGLAGLCGIPVLRDRIVRPLLDCSSLDIRLYCEENGLSYQHDETNDDMYYTRNRIRHAILPSMQAINPKVGESLSRLSVIAKEENAFLQRMANELIANAAQDNYFDCNVLLSEDPVIVKRALKDIVYERCGVIPQQSHVEQLYCALRETGKANLPLRYFAVVDNERLRIVRPADIVTYETIELQLDTQIDFGDRSVCAHRLSHKEFAEKLKVHKNLFDFCVSYDMINKGLFVRSRKTGDYMRPVSRECTKSLKKLYQEWGIPSEQRHEIPVICDADDNVLAVVGYAVSEEAAVLDKTADIIYIEIL